MSTTLILCLALAVWACWARSTASFTLCCIVPGGVYVFSEGFAFARGGKLDALRWEQIDSMLFSIVRRYMNGIYTGTQHKYTIRSVDGRQIVLNDRITNVEQLGDKPQRHGNARQIARGYCSF